MSLGGKFPGRIMQSEMGRFEPNLISDFPGMEVSGCSGGHEFSSGVMGSEGFFSGFVKSS